MQHHSDSKFENQRQGAIGVVLDSQSRFLVIQRSALVRAPGRLCFPGGEIEESESQETALVRELREELSVSVTPIRKLWQSETQSKVLLHWWLAELSPEEIPRANPQEVSRWFWMGEEQFVRDPRTLATNVEFVRAIHRGDVLLK